MTDTILQIVIKISELLKKYIDSLNLPAVLKVALKKIKCFFIPQTENEAVKKDAKHKSNAEETNAASREGAKEQ